MIKLATASAVAFVVYSCKGKLAEEDAMDITLMPVQTADSITSVQTPEGFAVYGYIDGGLLETSITADNARHLKYSDGRESWAAFGNVVVKNLIKREVMETDTLYWDQKEEKIWTDCYVKMYSPDGFMQGYGMESDQRARNSIIFRPFNSYGIVTQDSTAVNVDSVNFIGPVQRK